VRFDECLIVSDPDPFDAGKLTQHAAQRRVEHVALDRILDHPEIQALCEDPVVVTVALFPIVVSRDLAATHGEDRLVHIG
jgi:hypothetical protein